VVGINIVTFQVFFGVVFFASFITLISFFAASYIVFASTKYGNVCHSCCKKKQQKKTVENK
jgi:hypothetical protein